MTQQTKTLKELLFPNYSVYHDKSKKCADRTLNLVKEWLTQKYQFEDMYTLMYTNRKLILDELLEELNRNE